MTEFLKKKYNQDIKACKFYQLQLMFSNKKIKSPYHWKEDYFLETNSYLIFHYTSGKSIRQQ